MKEVRCGDATDPVQSTPSWWSFASVPPRGDPCRSSTHLGVVQSLLGGVPWTATSGGQGAVNAMASSTLCIKGEGASGVGERVTREREDTEIVS